MKNNNLKNLIFSSTAAVYKYSGKILNEKSLIGGFGSHLKKFLSKKGLLEKIKFRSITFPDKFIDQDKPDLMYQIAGLDSKAIEEKVYEVLDSKIVVQKKN